MENISVDIVDVYTVIHFLIAADKSREVTYGNLQIYFFFLQLYFRDSLHNPR